MKKITFCMLLLSAAASWSQQQPVAVQDVVCTPVAAFSQNFDAAVLPALPDCWTTILRGETLQPEAFIRVAAAPSVHTAPNAVQFYNSYSDLSTDYIILVSPQLSSLNATPQRLRFFAKGSGSLQIGTLDSNLPDAEFTPFGEDIATADATAQYVVDFSAYTGTDTFIGIRMTNANFDTSVFVDGISWEVIPSCPDVSGIIVPEVTTQGATVTWSEGGSEAAWEVAVAPISVNDPDSATVTAATGTTQPLTALNPATQYKVWVRSVCAVADKGVWIGPVIFTTSCIATDYVNESFDNVVMPELPTCWTTIISGPEVGNSSILTSAYNVHTAPYSVNLYAETPATETNNVIFVSPNLTTVAGGYRLKFYAQGGAPIQVGTLSNNTASAVFTSIEDITTTNEDKEYIVEFGGYSGTDHYVGIRMNNTDYSALLYVDNVVFEAIPSCLDVTDLYASGIAPTTADVSWAAGGSETSWQVVYSDQSVNPSTLTPHTVSTAMVTLEGLVPSTGYNVWVRSVCSSVGAWVGPLVFKTDCSPVADFFENFDENVDSSELPSCWKGIVSGSSGYVHTSIEAVHSAPNCAKLSTGFTNNLNDNIILVSPNLSSLSLSSHQLEFYARHNNENVNLEIGTLDSNGPDAEFTMFEQVTLTNTAELYTIDFTGYSGASQYIGFRLVNNNTTGNTFLTNDVYIDDVLWRNVPLCPDVTQVVMSEVGITTAAVSWSNETESPWQVVYAPSSVTDPSTITPILDTTTAGVSLTGLTANTGYKVWVRSVCGAGYGYWVGPLAFTTLCDAVNVPYTEDFESVQQSELPACTNGANEGAGNAWQVFQSPGSGFQSFTLTYPVSFDGAANAWFYTRGINLTAGTSYTISYNYGNNGYSEKLLVAYGNSPKADAMSDLLADYNGFIAESPIADSYEFTPAATGVYYFGFNAYSEMGMGDIYVDDIHISPTLGVGNPEQGQFRFYPNPVKDQLHLSYTTTISSVVIYNLLGQEVLNQSIDAETVSVNVSDLAQGTYVVKVNAGNLVKTIKMIKE